MNEEYISALDFAFEKYNGVKREVSNLPYIIHPFRVVMILQEFGYTEEDDQEILISALLHDVLEESRTKLKEITVLFGERVGEIVSELTQPKRIKKDDWLERFDSCSKEARLIKLVDRIDNLRDMEQNNFPAVRFSRYIEQSKIIVRTCGDADPNLALELELLLRNLNNR